MKAMEIAKTLRYERDLLEKNDPRKLERIDWLIHVADRIKTAGVPLEDVLVCDIALEIGAAVLDMRCDRPTNKTLGTVCGSLLIQKHDQDLAYCWICFTTNTALVRAKATLLKLKTPGMVVTVALPTIPKAISEEDERPYWPEGVPL